jgi:hypothetical protein
MQPLAGAANLRDRLIFLSHFVICLAVAALAFFGWLNGVLQTVYVNDLSMMTSLIGALFVGTAAWLGRQAWVADDRRQRTDDRKGRGDLPSVVRPPSSDFGHLAERLCVMAGLAGTTIGLSLQAKALMSGSASFGALSTSLYTTASGVAAAALIAIMVFNLEAGMRRMGR